MPTSQWTKAVHTVRDHVILIETPAVRGTGFVVPTPPGLSGTCVITAWHVISHAEQWREPIKLTRYASGKEAFLDVNSRAINSASGRDQAIILFSADDFPLPTRRLEFHPVDRRYNEGMETGWLGYPVVSPSNLCFFCGHISTWLDDDEAYLVDGVAINGVSGGPAFVQDENENPVVIGIVTEYRPNLATGNALPGVSLVRSIIPLLKYYAEGQKKLEAAKVQDIPREGNGGEPTALPAG